MRSLERAEHFGRHQPNTSAYCPDRARAASESGGRDRRREIGRSCTPPEPREQPGGCDVHLLPEWQPELELDVVWVAQHHQCPDW